MELTIQKRGKNIYRKVTFILIFQFIFTIHFTVQAKNYQYRFKHLDKTDGLSHNRILCIHEDNKGFMWFGTASGLNRYDGYSFKIFKHDPNDTTTISNDFINNIWEDHKDRLWIESGNMVNIYDPLTETFSRNTGKILRDVSIPDTATISNIIKDSRGNFWFLHPAFGIYRYSTEQDTVIKIASNPNDSSALSFPNISAMAEDLQGNFWLANQHGIIEKLDSKTNKIVYRNDFLFKKYNGTNLVIKLCIDNDNDLWLVIGNYDQGVYFFNTTKNEFKHYHKDSKNLKLNINITAEIIQDNNGLIWIATDQGGINIINKKDLSVRYIMNDLEDENSLSQNTVTTLYIDDMGIIWAGTYKKGIDYYHPAIIKFKHYRKKLLDPQSLPYNDVNCYVEDKQDNVWIGTNGGGLIHFDRENDVFSQFIHNPDDPSSISTNTIVSLCLDHENKLWIGTFYGGINCYDGKRFYRYLPDPSNLNSISCYHIWSIYEDSENNLWIGTLNQGVDRFDRKKKAFYHYKGEKNNSIFQGHPVNAILEDYKGNILFGTTSGIDILDKKSGNFIQYPGNSTNAGILKNESINKIIMDKRGLLWAATQNGLMLLDQEFNLLRTFKIKDGLPDDIIISLIEDNYGNLWMGTPNGLSNLIINKKKDTDSLFFSFKNYNESDGLQGREFNQFSAIKLQSGELIFGGANGFNLFSPEEIEMNKRIPNVVFTDFQIFNKSISINDTLHGRIILNKSISQTEDIVLKYHENMFSIEFAALSYFNPDKNKYVYMLEGFNDEWLYTDAKSRKVTYTSLDPGEYIFKVKGSNNDGIWNEEGTTIRISVTPPFWQTAWFRILTVLFIITLIYIIYKIRIRNIEAHRRELEIKVKERTHELKEAYEEITDKANALEVAKKETDNILHNVEEGFFLLDKEYTISSQYSSALESIFSTQEIAHLNLIDFIRDKIPASEIENTMIYFTLLFDESVDENSIETLNPLVDIEFVFTNGKYSDKKNTPKISKYLNFSFRRIRSDDNKIIELIVTVRDVTRSILLAKQLKEEEARRERLLQLMLGILDVEPDMLNEFSESAQRELAFIDQIMNHEKIEDYQALLVKVHRAMHLIKGNAKLLNIDYFAQAAHQFEDLISEVQKKTKITHEDIEPLRAKLRELETGIEEMEKIIEKMGQVLTHKGGKKRTDARSLLLSLENLIKSFSSDLGKKIKFDYKKFQSKIIPSRYHLLVKEVLIQLIRNSISHGIEFPEERKRLKKPQYGKIEISTFKRNGSIGFRLRDDGRGIQIKKLKEKALQSGRWDKEEIEKWDDNKIAELIFASGISTAERVDMIAGRGVGMDGVIHRLKEYRGEIQVHFTEGQYCEFEVILPVI